MPADVQAACTMGTNAPLYQQRGRLLNCVLLSCQMAPLLFNTKDVMFVVCKKKKSSHSNISDH